MQYYGEISHQLLSILYITLLFLIYNYLLPFNIIVWIIMRSLPPISPILLLIHPNIFHSTLLSSQSIQFFFLINIFQTHTSRTRNRAYIFSNFQFKSNIEIIKRNTLSDHFQQNIRRSTDSIWEIINQFHQYWLNFLHKGIENNL